MSSNPFTDHPASVGETYGEHLVAASGFGLGMTLGVSGIPGPVESPALGILTIKPLINRFVRDFPFGGIKALSQVMEEKPDSIRVRAAWALIETLYAGHPDWLRAIRAPDCNPLDDWAISHRARLLADLTELGGRPSSDVTTYDELRELAYMVATMTDEQEQLASLGSGKRL